MKKITFLALIVMVLPSCKFVSASEEAMDRLSEIAAESSLDKDSPKVVKTLQVGDFTTVKLDGGAEIEYTVGTPALRIEASQETIDKYVIEVKDGTLSIKPASGKVRNIGKLEIHASSSSIAKIEVNGACEFDSEGLITTDKFVCKVNGAGKIDIEDGLKAGEVKFEVNGAGELDLEGLDCAKLSVQINGAGDAQISGKAAEVEVGIAGAGKIDVSELVCDKFSKSVAGAGKIKR